MKKILSHIFVDGINGMALGILCTYSIGTILQQIGKLLNPKSGDLLISLGGLAIILTGAGIAAGMASKFGSAAIPTLSAIIAGMVGAHAKTIYLNGLISKDGHVMLKGPGDTLCAFAAAFIALEIGNLISGKTELDLLLTPITCTGLGCCGAFVISPFLTRILEYLVYALDWSMKQNDFIMGALISCLGCLFSLLPVSLITLVKLADVNGISAGALTIGCCCSMIGFAVASFRDNKIGGLFLQGLGTPKLQLANTLKRPHVILPPLISSAILGCVATGIFHFTNTPSGSTMGTTGLVGCISAYNSIMENVGSTEALIIVSLLCFVLPGVISLGLAEMMRKIGLLKEGQMKIGL
jgi:hypothetical protein